LKGRKSKNREVEKAKITRTSLKKALGIFRFIKPFLWKYYLGLIFLFLTSITALVFPYLLGELVDSANKGEANTQPDINKLALILMCILVAQAFFSFFRIYLFSDVTESMLALLRQTTYSHLIRLPMSFFSKHRVGELNSRISSDISQLQETFTTTLAEFLRQAMIIVGGVFMLAYTSVKLTGVMLAIVPVVVLAAVFFGRFIRKISKDVQDKIAESGTIVEETLQGISNVKAFTNEFFETSRYNASTDGIKKHAMKGALWRGMFASFIIFCLFGAIVGVIWYAMLLVDAGTLSYGEMFRFLLLSVFVGASIGGIAELYAQIQRAIGATERILELLGEETETALNENNNITASEKIIGTVNFSSVGFTYPSRKDFNVLKNITFSSARGEHVAIVGPSGAGKSTIVSLLLRFYKPDSGKIIIDNKDSQSYDLAALRSQIAIVPQEVLLFGGTIYENIAYGKPNATQSEIYEAAEKANAKEFIEKFPEKYQTVVGERGVQLSGGQRQRIAIARAVLKNPAILILDEATSSLDSESERLVQEALEKLMKGRTTFVIAHRLSTIRKADKILVIDQGEIKESGTHDDLFKKENGIYRNLSMLQYELQD
jgi:ABC transporter fused permease/ATP-binding protein